MITLNIKDLLNKTTINENINFPSLGSSLAACSSEIQLRIDLVENTEVVTILSKIWQILTSLNEQIKSDKPMVLIRAWGLFYSLKDVAVPLDSLEEHRRKDPWLKTINYNIEQISEYCLAMESIP